MTEVTCGACKTARAWAPDLYPLHECLPPQYVALSRTQLLTARFVAFLRAADDQDGRKLSPATWAASFGADCTYSSSGGSCARPLHPAADLLRDLVTWQRAQCAEQHSLAAGGLACLACGYTPQKVGMDANAKAVHYAAGGGAKYGDVAIAGSPLLPPTAVSATLDAISESSAKAERLKGVCTDGATAATYKVAKAKGGMRIAINIAGVFFVGCIHEALHAVAAMPKVEQVSYHVMGVLLAVLFAASFVLSDVWCFVFGTVKCQAAQNARYLTQPARVLYALPWLCATTTVSPAGKPPEITIDFTVDPAMHEPAGAVDAAYMVAARAAAQALAALRAAAAGSDRLLIRAAALHAAVAVADEGKAAQAAGSAAASAAAEIRFGLSADVGGGAAAAPDRTAAERSRRTAAQLDERAAAYRGAVDRCTLEHEQLSQGQLSGLFLSRVAVIRELLLASASDAACYRVVLRGGVPAVHAFSHACRNTHSWVGVPGMGSGAEFPEHINASTYSPLAPLLRHLSLGNYQLTLAAVSTSHNGRRNRDAAARLLSRWLRAVLRVQRADAAVVRLRRAYEADAKGEAESNAALLEAAARRRAAGDMLDGTDGDRDAHVRSAAVLAAIRHNRLEAACALLRLAVDTARRSAAPPPDACLVARLALCDSATKASLAAAGVDIAKITTVAEAEAIVKKMTTTLGSSNSALARMAGGLLTINAHIEHVVSGIFRLAAQLAADKARLDAERLGECSGCARLSSGVHIVSPRLVTLSILPLVRPSLLLQMAVRRACRATGCARVSLGPALSSRRACGAFPCSSPTPRTQSCGRIGFLPL